MGIWEVLAAIIGSGAFSALISGGFGLLRDRKTGKDGVREGVRQLLYNEIKRTGRQYLAAGKISSEDLEDFIDTHRIYHDELSGNGYLDGILQKVLQLDVKD
mgnify:CR=1 FL=1